MRRLVLVILVVLTLAGLVISSTNTTTAATSNVSDDDLVRIKSELGIIGIPDERLRQILDLEIESGLTYTQLVIGNLDAIEFGYKIDAGIYWSDRRAEFLSYFNAYLDRNIDYINYYGSIVLREALKSTLNTLIGPGAGYILVDTPHYINVFLDTADLIGVLIDVYIYRGMFYYIDSRKANESQEEAWYWATMGATPLLNLSTEKQEELKQGYEEAWQASIVYSSRSDIINRLRALVLSAGIPNAQFTANPDSGLPPLTVHFDASQSEPSTGETIVSYSWDFDDTGGETWGSDIQPYHKFDQVGQYEVTLTVVDTSGVSGIRSQTVQVQNPLTATFSMPGFTPGSTPKTVVFNASASSNAFGVIESYEWDFGDPQSGSLNYAAGVSVSHEYMNDGYYIVTLTISESGYVARLKQSVTLGNQGPTYISSGTMDYHTTWTEYWSPYVISGYGLTVAEGATLTISPGVIVKFMDGSLLDVYGSLVADGASGQEITFTSWKDDSVGGDTNGDGDASAPTPSIWQRLQFRASSQGNVLDHVMVRYPSYGVRSFTSGLTISNSSITDCYQYGIELHEASPVIFGNTISTGGSSTGIRMESSSPIIDGNSINDAYMGIYVTGVSDPDITGNSIEVNSYPIYFHEPNSSGATISGNTFSGPRPHIHIWSDGNITNSLTWSSLDAPYVISKGNPHGSGYGLTVAEGATLTISPGVIVKFMDGSLLDVYGSLVADGASGQEITFTSWKDDSVGGDTNGDGDASAPTPSIWQRLQFRASSQGNVLDHVMVRYPSYGVRSFTSGLTISNSSITDCYQYGIELHEASPVIFGNTISTGGSSTGIRMESSSPIIDGNSINDAYMGIYVTGVSDPDITGNNIENNVGYGIYNKETSVVINAENNWWGHESGPMDDSDDTSSGGLYNPTGLGDRVSDYVDYIPWMGMTTNNPPVADVGGPYTVDEGEALTLHASGSYDPDDDIILYEWDMDDDGEYDDADGVTTIAFFDNDGVYIVGLRVTDTHGETDTDTTSITVNDLGPIATLTGDAVLDEGQTGSYDATGSTSSQDVIVLYEWDMDNDGQYDDAIGITTTVVFDDNGTYTVAVRVTDDDGSMDIATLFITILNQPPEVNAGSDQAVDLGDPVSLDAKFIDSGILDTHTATINWGDGNSEEGTLTEPNGGPGSVTGSHIYSWPGIYDVTVKVTDDDGGVGSYLFVVEVLPVPEVMVENLSVDIAAMNLPASTINSLTTLLDTATKVLKDSNQKNDVAAINALEAFINKLEAQRGKKIPSDVADTLIAKAQEIIAVLSEEI